jgi:hypothetical protein
MELKDKRSEEWASGESVIEGVIPPDGVLAPNAGTCAGSACPFASLSWDGNVNKYLARNNHPTRSIKVTLPGVWGGTANSVVLGPHTQQYMLFTAFTNPWHADFV